MFILALTLVVIAQRLDHGYSIRHGLGYFRQANGNIKRLIHIEFCGFFAASISLLRYDDGESLSWQDRQYTAIPVGASV